MVLDRVEMKCTEKREERVCFTFSGLNCGKLDFQVTEGLSVDTDVLMQREKSGNDIWPTLVLHEAQACSTDL